MKFNTAGPCDPRLHYMLPAASRIANAREYITEGEYFVLHAPRQSGKTTALLELARQLNDEGEYAAVPLTSEEGESLQGDVAAAESGLLEALAEAAAGVLEPAWRPPSPWPDAMTGRRLRVGLKAWVARCPKPLVLLLDEIDALQGESLRSVLRQLRAGYTFDRSRFVHSVMLCGLRDVRDYKVASGGEATRLGSSSPFNIMVESVRLGDFTRAEVAELYAQHTTATGQEFTTRALDLACHYSQGQPWLVNALASEVIRRMKITATITDDHIDEAKERLILARATHLDSLVAKLTEPRVERVIQPIIAGGMLDSDQSDQVYLDDVSYVRDLGLIAANDKDVRIANPIYNEVIIRVLGAAIELKAQAYAPAAGFRLPDGRLDLRRLLEAFVSFWVEHGETLDAKRDYHEVAPQLVLMAFIHRIVNGGGFIDREYGVGRGRIDLLIRQPYTDSEGHRAWQRQALELKIHRDHDSDDGPLEKGLVQLDAYLDRLRLDTGVLVIFDRRTTAAPIHERTGFSETTSPAGRAITILRA